MGAYAVPSDKGFVTSKPLVRKRKRGRVDEGMEFIAGAEMDINENGELVLIKNGEVIGVFKDDGEQ